MSKNKQTQDLGLLHIAEVNKDWLKSEVLNKKWVLINAIIFSICLDFFVLVSEKDNDLVSKMGTFGRLVTLVLLGVLFYLIYQTEGKIENEKNKKGP